MLEIMLQMDRTGDGLLNKEFCHVDGNHKRCSGFKRITLWMYHIHINAVLKLATMEVESENKEGLQLFWKILNTALQEFSQKRENENLMSKFNGNHEIRFHPHGYITDEAGAFWNSIKEGQGEEDVIRTVSCEKHFDFTVKREEKKLADEDEKEEFLQITNAVLKAETPLIAECAAEKMQNFINADHQHLQSLWDWWWQRRTHVFRAYKGMHNIPKSNLAEVGHSKWVKTGGINLTLIDAAREDVAESIRQASHLRCFEYGTYKGGAGIAFEDLTKK